MEYNKWIRLDNASNIFVAASNAIDTKVFRLSVEMTENIEPSLLQTALNHIYEEYPLFHSTLRRGFFWYYFEKSDVNPRIKVETETPLSPIYQPKKKDFLFRVLYKENRIHLEVFHALTDGTGALWFLEDLVSEYVRIRYVKETNNKRLTSKREKDDLEDSFNRYFKERKETTPFTRLLRSFKDVYQGEKTKGSFVPQFIDDKKEQKIYRVKGTYTPDHRPRIINVNLPLNESLALARREKVSLTIYMTALYVLASYQAKEDKTKETTISVSIPINLRQYFPSITVRNFFSTTTIDYTFAPGEEGDLSVICKQLNEQFQKQLKKEALERRLKRHIEFEFNPVLRVLLRPLKDLILKGVNKLNNRNITLSMSNLGIVHLPTEVSSYIENVYFYSAPNRPHFGMISHGDTLNISLASPFVETDIFKNFIQYLSAKDLDITVDANKVTREELEK